MRRNQRQRRNLITGMASALLALAIGAALGVTFLHLEATADAPAEEAAIEQSADSGE